MWPIRTVRAYCAGTVATAVALAVFVTSGTHAAGARETNKPQAYPVPGLFHPCSGSVTPDWHYGETSRHYQSDGTLQFTKPNRPCRRLHRQCKDIDKPQDRFQLGIQASPELEHHPQDGIRDRCLQWVAG